MKQETAYWLALVNGGGIKLNRLKPLVQQWYLMEGKPLSALFNLSVTELTVRFNLTEPEAQAILNAARQQQNWLQAVENWQTQGIEVLPLCHPLYPQRLIYTLPPQQQPLLLWAKGATTLLAEPTITVLGSPETNPEMEKFVQDLAATLVEENIGVVSGYGKGPDRLAFEAMIGVAGGKGVAILPMGLTAFSRITNRLDAPITAGQAVLLSPFAPDTPFKDSLADARTLLVDSLAMALLVPQIDSVSLPRARAALERGMPVLVGKTDTPESRALLETGAFLMTDFNEVIELVQQAVIDNAMQAQMAQAPAVSSTVPVVAGGSLLNDTDNYALHTEVISPLSASETLDILAGKGNIPLSLRQKLVALEQKKRDQIL